MNKYDIIIVGAGPAGVSASIYIRRSNLNVLVLYSGTSELERAHKIENYYGFENGITGKELYNKGIVQAKNLGVNFLEKEVLSIEIEEDSVFQVKTSKESFKSRAIIIATGNKKLRPNIKGLENFEGKGVSYCAICDAFFYKNKNVAVIGNGNFALHEASDLVNIVNNVKILTNGEEAPNTDKFEIDTRIIKQVKGDKKVSSIEFEDGKLIEVEGIFIAQGIAGGGDFAKKLGIISNNDKLIVNENMETNVKGIFACGDLTGGLLQVSKAVYEGAKAGIQAANYLKSNIGYH